MIQNFPTLILIRIVLPLCFLFCSIFRYNGLSLMYLILFLTVPYLKRTMQGNKSTGQFLLIVMFITALTFVAQMFVQVLMYTYSLNGNTIAGMLLEKIGLVPLYNFSHKEKVRHLYPEILMFCSSLFIYSTCRKLTAHKRELTSQSSISCKQYYHIFWNCVLLSTLYMCGTVLPSALNIVYFLAFIIGMTVWACHKGKYISPLYLKLMCIFTALHIIVLYVSQMQGVQKYLLHYSNLQRYLGLSILVNQTSSDLNFVKNKWTKFLNAVILLWLSYILSILKHFHNEKVLDVPPKTGGGQDATVELLELFKDVMKIKKETGNSDIIQKILSSPMMMDISRQQNAGKEKKKSFTWLDLLVDVATFMREMSFLWTHIIMMVWSFQYHSWLAFVWLLMFCLLWILPHPKQLTLLCSPIILGYALVLLLIKYMYSMELNAFERPESETLYEIGLGHHDEEWPKHLFIQSLYTTVFWITMHERKPGIKWRDDRHTRAFMIDHKVMIYRNTVIEKFMTNAKTWLVKFWIWVVVIIIFIYSFNLFNMCCDITVAQLVYMFLVLLFVFILQVSYNLWCKLLKTFWIIFILWSAVVLVLQYVYGFRFAHQFLEQTVHIPLATQQELGLWVSTTKQLSRELWIPAFVMIIVGIQLHYFHREMMHLIKIKQRDTHLKLEVEVVVDQKPHFESGAPATQNWKQNINYVVDKTWLFLALHDSKVLLLYLIILCVINVCAIHMMIILVMLNVLLFRGSVLRFMVPITTGLASVIILLLAVYQFNFFDHNKYNTICSENNITRNIAEWVGFKKISSEDLFHPITLYLIEVIIGTIMTVIDIRQKYVHYLTSNEPYTGDKVMFPEIKRKDADTNLRNCFQFVLNYGFYRFGAEICLIIMMILVLNLMDAFALYHVLWLWVLTFHQQSRKWWLAFQISSTLIIIINYAVLIDLPPISCLEYPWIGNSKLRLLQQWLCLPGKYHYLGARALIYNCLVLIAVYWRNVGFWIAKNYEGDYPGGSNRDITDELEHPDYVNPVHDHTSLRKSWLDPLKDCIMKILLVLLMALFFIAGLLDLNFFSPAYLVGSFFLFWQGYKIYLYPLRWIQQYWNKLLIFTLFIITFKSICQVVSIFQIEKMDKRLCSVAQMFHILYIGEQDQEDNNCYISRDTESILWDSMCYIILIIMKRFSRSCYVIHHVTDSKAQLCLASRGLQLMQELFRKKEKQKENEEKKILQTVRMNLESAKRNHKMKYKEMESHNGVVRVGDYFLFEDEQLVETEEEEEEEEEEIDRRITFTEFLGKVFLSGIKEAAEISIRNVHVSEVVAKDREESVYKDDAEKKKKSAVHLWLLVSWAFVVSSIESLITYLRRVSRDYHYIRVTVSHERQLLKEMHSFKHQGRRTHSNGQWMPNREEMINNRIRESKIQMNYENTLVRFIIALWNVFLSSSEHLCYFVILMYHLHSETLLALPLPFMVLMWGALTKPRPTQTFWTIVITYTEVSIVLKCIYNFEFMPWNKAEKVNSGDYRQLVSVFKRHKEETYDLILFCTLFFHRHMTRSLGLWNRKTVIVTQKKEKFFMDSSGLYPISNKDVKSQLLDVNHVHKSTSRLIIFESKEANISENMQIFYKLIFKEYSKSIGSFFYDLLYTTSHSLRDVYAWMFFCDFCIFLIFIFGFESFGQDIGATHISSYLAENEVPVKFVVMLMSQFVLMLVDRMLYLRRKMLARIIFFYTLVVGWYIWMFFLLPSDTNQSVSELLSRQMCHMIKCCYFLLSAYQIRNGYPTSILGNFLCKRPSLLNKILHQAYLQFPFLYELRTLTDWLWTDTSLSFYEWLKMEDIYANIFQRKCSQNFELKYSKASGTQTKILVKYSIAGGLVFIIILTIWFPLCIYAFIGGSTVTAIPHSVSMYLTIGSHPKVYLSYASGSHIHQLDENKWSLIKRLYQQHFAAAAFLDNYFNSDVAVLKFASASGIRWDISPPEEKIFISELKSNDSIEVKLTISVIRQQEKLKSLMEIFIVTTYKLKREDCLLILMMLKLQRVTLNLPLLLPKFIRISSVGRIEAVGLFMDGQEHRNLTLGHRKMSDEEWWEMREECDDDIYESDIKYWDDSQCKGINIITFNERTMPKILLFLSGSGIISLYLGFVYICFRVFRLVFGNLSRKIIYTDMPYVDRILQLCLEIYLARENRDFALEEELFAKLLFLYRSPETMIKYTRFPEEWRTGTEQLQHRL